MDTKRIEKISKALADETRLRIFQAIANPRELDLWGACEPERRYAGDDFPSPEDFDRGGADRMPQRRPVCA